MIDKSTYSSFFLTCIRQKCQMCRIDMPHDNDHHYRDRRLNNLNTALMSHRNKQFLFALLKTYRYYVYYEWNKSDKRFEYSISLTDHIIVVFYMKGSQIYRKFYLYVSNKLDKMYRYYTSKEHRFDPLEIFSHEDFISALTDGLNHNKPKERFILQMSNYGYRDVVSIYRSKLKLLFAFNNYMVKEYVKTLFNDRKSRLHYLQKDIFQYILTYL